MRHARQDVALVGDKINVPTSLLQLFKYNENMDLSTFDLDLVRNQSKIHLFLFGLLCI